MTSGDGPPAVGRTSPRRHGSRPDGGGTQCATATDVIDPAAVLVTGKDEAQIDHIEPYNMDRAFFFFLCEDAGLQRVPCGNRKGHRFVPGKLAR